MSLEDCEHNHLAVNSNPRAKDDNLKGLACSYSVRILCGYEATYF
jgi:hypothetical protein